MKMPYCWVHTRFGCGYTRCSRLENCKRPERVDCPAIEEEIKYQERQREITKNINALKERVRIEKEKNNG